MRIDVRHDTPKVIEALARAPEVMAKELGQALQRGAIEVADTAKTNAPKFRSELTNSIGVQQQGLMAWLISARGKAYGPYVEEGTGPGGRPPLREMIAWVRLKHITPRTPGMSERSLASLICRSIAQHGITPNPFFQRSLDESRPVLVRLIDSAADRAMASVAGAAP